jgi:hypothetical protein
LLEPLALKNSTPLVSGSRRRVFRHPTEPGLLVKVLISELGAEIPLGIPGLHIRRPNEMVRSFRREFGEYLRVRAKIPSGPIPIVRVFGVVETDIGTGLVVERISARDGGLAPSLKTHVRKHGFDPELERSLYALRDALIRLDIVAGDINTNNIVVGSDEAGVPRLVVVDGIGDKTFLPINSLSSWMNRLSHQRRFDRVIRRLWELDSER